MSQNSPSQSGSNQPGSNQPDPSHSDLSQSPAKSILVIEDERATRTSLLSFLRDQGFRVMAAENGLIGVQLAQEYLPDLIICDVIMPELDGYDVLRTLKQNPATAQIPFIFLTMTATVEGCQQSLAMGANDYLAKPVSSDQLRRAIAAQLDQTSPADSGCELKYLPNLSPLPSLTPGQPNRLASGELGLSYPAPFVNSFDLTQSLSPLGEHLTDLSTEELQGLLLERFSQVLLQRLTTFQRQLNCLQEQTDISQQLQQGCSQLLALISEVAAMQNTLTPENVATLLDRFTWDDPSL